MKNKVFKYQIIGLLLFVVTSAFAQKKQPTQEELALEAKRYVAEGNDYLVEDKNFPAAEGEYRKAIAKNPVYEPAKYNLGNAYYVTEKYDEALQRYGQTAKVTGNKQIKHLAFHNQGNTFMRQKKYDQAVGAYKNALRNNPTDDETRYNLALAKKMKEQQDKEDQKDKDQNKDDKKKDDKKDKKDGDNKDQKDKEGEKDDKKKDQEGKDEKDKKDDKKEGDDKKDGEDKKEEDGKPKEDKKEEGEDKKDGKGDKPEDKQQQKQPVPGQLSPQQVKSLLEAMNNQEKKVQEKINAKKVKGAKVQTEKDW